MMYKNALIIFNQINIKNYRYREWRWGMENLKLLPFAVFCIQKRNDLCVTNLCGWRVSMNVLKYKRALQCIALIQ
jgi:hypothetical protein